MKHRQFFFTRKSNKRYTEVLISRCTSERKLNGLNKEVCNTK